MRVYYTPSIALGTADVKMDEIQSLFCASLFAFLKDVSNLHGKEDNPIKRHSVSKVIKTGKCPNLFLPQHWSKISIPPRMKDHRLLKRLHSSEV